MCRNIKTLFNFDPPVTEEEIRAASLQFVRKISGFTKPSKANEFAFAAAIDEVAGVSGRSSEVGRGVILRTDCQPVLAGFVCKRPGGLAPRRSWQPAPTTLPARPS